MLTVGLRRTTRECGLVKKSVHSARVLRSGRHLWRESADKKQRKGGDMGECCNFAQSKGSGKQILWAKSVILKREIDVGEIESIGDHQKADVDAIVIGDNENGVANRMYGIVYSRKSKRKASDSTCLEEKMYGIHFTRRQKRKTPTSEVSEGFNGLAVVTTSAPASDHSALSTFLLSIWRYMKRVGLGLSDLSGFLTAEPISSIYAKNGIHFLWDPPSISGAGICKFFETSQSSPMFMLNFCAIPNCFFLMHVNMLLSHRSLPFTPVIISTDKQLYVEVMYGSDDYDDCSPFPSECDMAESEVIAAEDRVVQQQRPHRLPKSDGRTAQHRYGVRSRSIRKRRSALRSKISRNPSVLVLNRKIGALASDLVTAKRSGCPFSLIVSRNKARQFVQKRGAKTNHSSAPMTLGKKDDTDSSACALVASPPAAAAVSKIIPVPRVTLVSDYEELNLATFSILDTYITVTADEVTRAMAKTTANYDIDSEDEDWLKKFNSEQQTENELMTVETFELMIDAFEKAFYYNPHDFTQEKPDADICLDICKRDVEAVYSHWMKKRRQRRSALIRVFQAHQPKRVPLVPKPVLRKKRSLKRQPSQNHQGRGKQQNVLHALEEQDSFRRLEEAQTNTKRALEAAIEKRQRAQLLVGNADLASYRALMALRIAEAAEIAESPDQVISEFLDLKPQPPDETYGMGIVKIQS